MPITPFHLPPHALVGWPLRRRLDLPALLVANIAVDVEPLVRLLVGVSPPHGPVHTLLGGALAGALAGVALWRVRGVLEQLARARYRPTRGAAIASGALGGILHVMLDAVLYRYLDPFWPVAGNPLHLPGSGPAVHLLSALALVPVLLLAWRVRWWTTGEGRLSLALLVLSAPAMVALAPTT